MASTGSELILTLETQNKSRAEYIQTRHKKTKYRGVREEITAHMLTHPRFETIFSILKQQDARIAKLEKIKNV